MAEVPVRRGSPRALQGASRGRDGDPATGRKPLRAPKIAELVAEDIRRQIVGGRLRPGTSLPSEAELTRLYEVARPTLREALRLLESNQLLEVRRGSHLGWRVRLPDPSLTARHLTLLLELRGATLRDVYTARTLFEPPACRLAAERATPEGVDRLRRTLDAELDSGEQSVFPVVAWRFHTELAELSGNATIAVLSAALQHISQGHAARLVSARWDQTMWRRAYQAHQRVVDLIAGGKGREAETFWRRHMELAGEHLLPEIGDLPISEVL